MITGIGFQVASSNPGGGGRLPLTVEKAILDGYAENQGALLTVDVNGNFAACGADPIAVAAVALTPGGADTSGFNILGRKEFPKNTMQGAWVGAGQRFLAPFLGALPAVAGGQFGVTRDVDSVWKVDFNKLDNPVVVFLANPDRSPADAAGAGQDTLVIVQFIDNVVQPVA
jgi:hypothetical protein